MYYPFIQAGIKASIRGIDLVLEEGMNVKVLSLPEGEDPDSFAKKLGKDELLAYIKKNEADFIKFKTSILLKDAENDPIKRAQLIQDIVRTISVIPDPIVRSVYIKECSKLMNVEEPVLYTEIGKIKKKNKEKDAKRNAPRTFDSQKKTLIPNNSVALPTITDNVLETEEREVLRYLIRYGERMFSLPVTIENQEKSMSIGEYIILSLKQDDVTSQNPLHNQIIEEYEAQMYTPGFSASKYFVSHPNPSISTLVSDLIAHEYQLSRIHNKYAEVKKDEEILDELVPRVVTELKWKIVKVRMENIRKLLKQAQDTGDNNRVIELIKEMTILQRAFKTISEQHGERAII